MVAEGTGLQQWRHAPLFPIRSSSLPAASSLSLSRARARFAPALALPTCTWTIHEKETWNFRRGKIYAREGTLKTHSCFLKKKTERNKCRSPGRKKGGKSRKRKRDRDSERKRGRKKDDFYRTPAADLGGRRRFRPPASRGTRVHPNRDPVAATPSHKSSIIIIYTRINKTSVNN